MRGRPERRSGVLLLACVATCATLAGCEAAPDGVSRIRERGFIRAGYAQEPPYAFTLEDGQVDGEAPSALRYALRPLGVDSIRWVRLDFEDLLPALSMGRLDVVASGLFPTSERRGVADFTLPTTCARPALAFRSEDRAPGGIQAFTDGDDGEDVLAVVAGTVEHLAAARLGVPERRLLVVPDLATGLSAVRSGASAALALTAPTLSAALDGEAGLAWITYTPPEEVRDLVRGCSALAVRREDAGLLRALNEGLAAYLGTREHLATLARLGAEGAWGVP